MAAASFADRAEANAFVVERFPDAEPMPAISRLLGNPVLLEARMATVVRLHDWSDSIEDPEVNVDTVPAREWIRDPLLVEQTGMLLEDRRSDPTQVRAILDELTAIARAGVPPVWKDDPVLGLHAASDTARQQLTWALALQDAVRDRNATALLDTYRAAGSGLAEAATALHLEPKELAAMAAADYLRTLDPQGLPPGP